MTDTTASASRTEDIVRQSAVIAAAVFMLIGATVGGGAFGGAPVNELQNGALAADGSYLAPAGPAFAIWTVIYVGLAGYTIWQALPAQRADARQRRGGWWIAASMVLNGLWLVTARYGTLILTVLVIVALLAVLARIIVLLGASPARNMIDRLLVDATMGLHFGWVTIATVANTSAWLTQTLPEDLASQADIWGVTVLVIVTVIGVISALVTRRVSPAIASAWGLAWLAFGRLSGEPASTAIGVTAAAAAALILAAGVYAAIRSERRPVKRG
ncbi:TspO/MBR family protein [Microbacterium sp. NPDC056234]|uniref:TspO/MBR family protein n=1 Tax=Microbacterium sp. NPDC056234 TaxID=3345757 RepID=UPI0035D78930